jgi:predicted CopG family antitoxin
MKDKSIKWTITIPEAIYHKIRKEQLDKSSFADQRGIMKDKSIKWTITIPEAIYHKIRKEQLDKSSSADQIVIDALGLYFEVINEKQK